MWRVLVALLLGCSGEGNGGGTVDAAPISSGKFTPLLCTGGNPGDATCPITYVELDFGQPVRLTLIAVPMSPSLQLTSMFLSSSTTVHIDNMKLEEWCPDCFKPLRTTLLAASVDVGPSGAALADVTLASFVATQSLAISVDAIR